jgi:hypothetical protein
MDAFITGPPTLPPVRITLLRLNAGHRFYDFDSAQPGHPAGYCSNALTKRAKKSVSWLTTLTFLNIRHTRVILIKSPNWVGETHVRLLYLFQWGRV